METDRTVAPLVQISVGMWNDLLNRIAEIEDRLSPPDAAADPKPPTLREQVAQAWCAEFYGETSPSAQSPAPNQLDAADAVLAVVAHWLAAQSLWIPNDKIGVCGHQRDHDVRLLRGEAS